MRVLITGAEGQLAHEFPKVLGGDHELLLFGHQSLDLTRPDQIEKILTNEKPDIVINCAAYNDVDQSETKQELAFQVNSQGPKQLAAAAAQIKARLIHFSTNFVFDGKKPLPQGYDEGDPADPLGYYGKSKLWGERAVLAASPLNIVVRTAWLYGNKGWNFLKTLLKLAFQDGSVRVAGDQFGSFTWTFRLAEQVKKMIDAGGQGLYHATAEGFSSRYELAGVFFEKMGIDVELNECCSADFNSPAARPRNGVLENKRLKGEGILLMRDWERDLEEFILRYKNTLLELK